MSPRTLLSCLVSAALPAGLWGGLALAAGASPSAPGAEAGGAAAVLLASGAALVLFIAYRRRTGADGPGLAAAAVLACFPALPDAMASGAALPLLGATLALSLLVLFLAAPEDRGGSVGRMLGAALLSCAAAAAAALWMSPRAAAPALLPAALLLAPAGAVLAGEACRSIVHAAGAPEGRRRGFVLALALVLAAGAGGGYLRSRSWATPLAFWERASAADPQSPAATGALAEARAAAGDLPGAEAALRRFAEQVQSGAAAGRSREALLRGAEGAVRAAVPLLGSGGAGREAAAAAIEAARLLSPRSAVVLRGAGEAFLEAGNFPEAVKVLGEATFADPGDAMVWDALARALIPAARVDEALGAAQRASGLEPGNPAFARTYAEALLASGRGSDALTVLKESLGSPPFDPVHARAYSEAHRRLAGGEVSAGRSGRARRLLAAGLLVDPSSAACQEMKRGLDERYEAERAAHEALVAPGPDGTVLPDNLLLFASWLCRWGDFDKAKPLFGLLLEERGGTAAGPFQMGKEFWEGRGTVEGYEKAILAYRDALVRDPGYVEARNRLWQAYRALGRTEEAREAARRFLEIGRSHPDAVDAERFLADPGDGR